MLHTAILSIRVLEAEVRDAIGKNQVAGPNHRVIPHRLRIYIAVNLDIASLTFDKNGGLALFIDHHDIGTLRRTIQRYGILLHHRERLNTTAGAEVGDDVTTHPLLRRKHQKASSQGVPHQSLPLTTLSLQTNGRKVEFWVFVHRFLKKVSNFVAHKGKNFMRIFTLLLSILLCAATATAQPLTSERNEQPRSLIHPYNRATDAVQGDVTASSYIYTPSEWRFDEAKGEFSSYFPMGTAWLNRQVLVRIERATSAYELWVNGRQAGRSASGATATEFNVTKLATTGRNDLLIRLVESEENKINTAYNASKPAISGVEVICQPTIRMRDIICHTSLNDSGEGIAEFAVAVKCDALGRKSSKIEYAIYLNDSTELARGAREISLDMRREDTIRFFSRVPRIGLWRASAPHTIRLDLCNRVEGRPAEYISRKVGVRDAKLSMQKLYVNRVAAPLKTADYTGEQSLDSIVESGASAIFVTADKATEALLSECDRRGLYVIVCAPIDTTPFGSTIKRGGNPTNDPLWRGLFAELNAAAYHTTKHHPCVAGYAIGRGRTTGISTYESFLMMKGVESKLPIIYEGADGEWCSDKFLFR